MAGRRVKTKVDLKVVIVGDYDVGKTCLVHRYLDGVFIEGPPNTVGAAFFTRQWCSSNIAIWDTAGEEKFAGLTGFYCRHANAAIIAYDIRNENTFKSIYERHTKLLESAADNCLFVFVGTKLDLVTEENRQISRNFGIERAKQMNEEKNSITHPRGDVPFFETSAKSGKNISEVFEYIFETLVPNSVAYNTKNGKVCMDLNDKRTTAKPPSCSC